MKKIIHKIRWIKPIDFWHFKFINRPFDAILLVQHKNPPYQNGYECLRICKFSKKGGIGIDGNLMEFKFGTFNPENDYKKFALLEYQY